MSKAATAAEISCTASLVRRLPKLGEGGIMAKLCVGWSESEWEGCKFAQLLNRVQSGRCGDKPLFLESYM